MTASQKARNSGDRPADTRIMSGVERKTSREPNACYESTEVNQTSDPRVSKEAAKPRSVDDAPIRDAGTAPAVHAANASKIPSPPPLTAEQARDLPDAFLDLNDCHTVVNDVLDKCQTNTKEKALEEDTRRRLQEQDGGAP